MNAKEIPLSGYARSQLFQNRVKYWAHAIVVLVLAGFVSMGEAVRVKNGYIFFGGIAIILTWWALSWLMVGRTYRKNQASIILQNEADFNRSLQLREGLHRFKMTDVADYPVAEKGIEGDWKPFRVEHFISNSLRGEIVGEIELHGNILFGGILRGTMNGSMKGLAVPNLLDASSVLFLKGPSGTLRVLLSSPRTTREFLVKMIEHWLAELPKNLHTYKVLQEFSVADDHLLNPISNPQLVDSLDASCDTPITERPSVGVIGEKIQDGVVFATALEVNGTRKIFFPSGFFGELAVHVAPFLKQASEPKMLMVVQKG
jgi:hypothetical protein